MRKQGRRWWCHLEQRINGAARLSKQTQYILVQDRQCTCNVTFRRVRAIIVVVEKQYYTTWVCVCSLRHPECHAHAPYCHLQPLAPVYIFFFTLSHKRYDFRKKKLVNIKCVFPVSLQLLSERFFILRINYWDMIENVCRSSYKVPFIAVRL